MKKQTIKNLSRVIAALLISLPFLLQAEGPPPPLPPPPGPYSQDELVIQFKSTTPPSYIDALRIQYNAVEVWANPTPVNGFRLWRITFPTNTSPQMTDINEVVNGSKTDPEINSICHNFGTRIGPSGNTIYPGSGRFPPDYFCPGIFNDSCGAGQTVTKVSILDTGIGYNPAAARLVRPVLFEPFYNYSNLGYDYVHRDLFPEDDNGHGTHVAGIIAALARNNGATTLKLLSMKTHDSSGLGSIANILLAVDRSILNNVQVINMSFSYQDYPPSILPAPLEVAINSAGSHGILVVASSGNDGKNNDTEMFPYYPASFTCANIISAASVNCSEALSTFSHRGMTSVDIAALGESVVAPDHTGTMVAKDGTSASAAYVSGLGAILYTHLITQEWSPVHQSITNSAHIPSPPLPIKTRGVVHFENALDKLLTIYGMGYRTSEKEAGLNELEKFKLFPNPITSSFTAEVKLPFNSLVQINMYNIQGRLILSKEEYLQKGIQQMTTHLPIELPRGAYVIQLRAGDQYYSQKMIKQ